jgi:hypothetical protein
MYVWMDDGMDQWRGGRTGEVGNVLIICAAFSFRRKTLHHKVQMKSESSMESVVPCFAFSLRCFCVNKIPDRKVTAAPH